MNKQFLIPNYIIEILHVLCEHNAQAFLVGGCVRDFLMKRTLHDYDITTSAKPTDMITWFEEAGYSVIPTGLQHGTISVLRNDELIEITTYRIDMDYQNHRSPQGIRFTSNLEEDLQRRDFTINAIAYHPTIGFIDPFHGQEDINASLIRCVGDPMKRFEEDALRILRALRFCAQLNFTIHKDTWEAIKKHHRDLTYVSKERIRDEFNKILLANKKDTLRFLREANVLLEIIPCYHSLYDYKQPTHWHIYDVFTHTDVALNHTTNYSLCAKLAIVFHDLGKPQCCTIDEQGHAHYKGHALVSTQLAQQYLRELHYDKASIQRICTLIMYHDYYVRPSRKVLRKYLSKFDNDVSFALEALDVQIADNYAKNPELAQDLIDNVERCKEMILLMEQEQDMFSLKDLAINGHDLLKLGYRGKQIGSALTWLYELVLEEPSLNEKEILLHLIKRNED